MGDGNAKRGVLLRCFRPPFALGISPRGYNPPGMSDRDRKLTDLPNTLRERIAEVPDTVRHWRDEIAREPTAVFQSPPVRIALWIVAGVVVLLTARGLIGGLTLPGGGKGWEKATPWATLYVACTVPACRHTWSTQQPLDFKDWPLTCEKCRGPSGFRAALCSACRRWSATPPGAATGCPFCAEAAEKRAAPASQPSQKKRGDDEEDPW